MSKETLSPASLARPMILDILAASLKLEDRQWLASIMINDHVVLKITVIF